MKPHKLLLFADRLSPIIGGMEMHADAFINYFTDHPRFPLSAVITKNEQGVDYLRLTGVGTSIVLKDLPGELNPMVLFFNSGRWIERLAEIRALFPNAHFVYRTGGNEILKAALTHQQIPQHRLRVAYWVKEINQAIDLMITNSAYTERRLVDIGITCPFLRCVGGVNVTALKPAQSTHYRSLTLFCAARFVPYKNHALLLSVVSQLISRGHCLRLRLAGDGPLLESAKQQVFRYHLIPVVTFLGALDNMATCHEIASADVYIQLSSDHLTPVPGGSYVHSEGMGRAILEAITAGTFVIAGHSGALSEIVTAARGVLLDLDPIDQLIEKIEKILRSLPPRTPLVEAFGWQHLFRHYEALFESMYENIVGHRKILSRSSAT